MYGIPYIREICQGRSMFARSRFGLDDERNSNVGGVIQSDVRDARSH